MFRWASRVRTQTRGVALAPALAVVLAVVVLAAGCTKKKIAGNGSKPGTNKEALTESETLIVNLIESEDLILDLTPRLGRIAEWFQENSAGRNGELPDDLAGCKTLVGLAETDPETLFHSDSSEPDFLKIIHWPIADPITKAANPWEPANQLNVAWETLKFGVIAGDFATDRRTEISLHTKIEGRGQSPDGSVFGMKGHQEIVFTKSGDDWNLTGWIQEDFFVERSSRPLFREVLAEVVKDADVLSNAQRSFKDEIIINSSKKGSISLPIPEFAPWTDLHSQNILPSVSVVDYNNDGLDDLFLTAQWGPTQMLENQGDGTYNDVAKEVGLYEDLLVNCVLFVDLDNDGDKDAIMGRPMEPTKYLRNDDGKFSDVTKSLSDLGKQYFTCAISASDVNRDGLIDIYLSNYPPLNTSGAAFEDSFLNDEERRIFLEKRATSDRWLNLAGSANVLLMNRGGGRLERVPYDELLAQWHRSYQAVWSDIDSDGDDDLYVCNDFAPDSLLRNDTPRGAEQPVFTDITTEALTYKGFGFGMGASFGDFDRDGDLDLYVSNMFSKAGRRIIQKVKTVDRRIEVAAAGSFLFVNTDGTFDQKAGSGNDHYHVNQVGWSYGGQWGDFDNNGQLDLYVPTGYYTAPKEIDTLVDT